MAILPRRSPRELQDLPLAPGHDRTVTLRPHDASTSTTLLATFILVGGISRGRRLGSECDLRQSSPVFEKGR